MAKDKKTELEQTIALLQERIQSLESSREKEQMERQNYGAIQQELAHIKQKYADDLFAERKQTQDWHDRARKWQHDYEQLRVQKGGFGFRSMAAVVFATFITGVVICYLLMKLIDQRDEKLQAFRQTDFFQVEYALTQGNVTEAKRILNHSQKLEKNEPIKASIEMVEQVVNACEKGHPK
ncbi:MAG: hypothetical protein R2792_15935 [Saprospiraceae bacterium]